MFCDFQTSIELEEISFPSSFQFWTNICFANKLLKLWWMKKEKNRKQEIMNFSFFNRNYPSLFCYASIQRKTHNDEMFEKKLEYVTSIIFTNISKPITPSPQKKPPNIKRCLIEIFMLMLIIQSKLKSKHYYYSLYL